MTPLDGIPVRVLLVEDHPALAYALRQLLESDDRLIVVDHVDTGGAACDHPLLGEIDVVLTDVHLPDIDGFRLVQTLHQSHPDVRVVVMSGSGDDATATEALSKGAVSFLEKGSMYGEVADHLLNAALAPLP